MFFCCNFYESRRNVDKKLRSYPHESHFGNVLRAKLLSINFQKFQKIFENCLKSLDKMRGGGKMDIEDIF